MDQMGTHLRYGDQDIARIVAKRGHIIVGVGVGGEGKGDKK